MSDVPPLHEALALMQDDGLVGEEENALCCLVLLPWGATVGIKGLSSTGKTWMLERVIRRYEALNQGSIYDVPTSASPTALFYNAREANSAPVHVWGDITELPQEWEKILKCIGEGKPADRAVTDMTLTNEDGEKGDIRNQVIAVPRTTFLLWATNNDNFDIQSYAELGSRMFELSTDATPAQTQAINDRHAEIEAGLYEPKVDPERKLEIDTHLRDVMQFIDDFDSQGGRFLNPVLPEISKAQVLPNLFPESRRDFHRLKQFMQAMALYHFKERPRFVDENGKSVLVVTPADAWMAMKIYGEKMVMSALGLTHDDVAVLSIVRSRKSAMTAAQVRERLADPNQYDDPLDVLNLQTKQVRRSLETMANSGFIQENADDSPKTYQPGFFAPQVDHSTSLPWEAVIEQTMANARASMPDFVAEDYISRYCEEPAALHPVTGEEVSILDDESFDTELAAQAEARDDAMASDPWGSSDETEPAAGETAQGTL